MTTLRTPLEIYLGMMQFWTERLEYGEDMALTLAYARMLRRQEEADASR